MIPVREERRVCVVLYKEMEGYIRYAVLQRVKNWEGWELVKGHLEDEDPADAAVREVGEEAGIDEVEAVEEIDHTVAWTYEDDGEEVHAVCDCFLVKVSTDAYIDTSQNPHDEHGMGHFLNYRDAHDILTYDDQRALLEAARDVLEG